VNQNDVNADEDEIADQNLAVNVTNQAEDADAGKITRSDRAVIKPRP